MNCRIFNILYNVILITFILTLASFKYFKQTEKNYENKNTKKLLLLFHILLALTSIFVSTILLIYSTCKNTTFFNIMIFIIFICSLFVN